MSRDEIGILYCREFVKWQLIRENCWVVVVFLWDERNSGCVEAGVYNNKVGKVGSWKAGVTRHCVGLCVPSFH